MSGAGVSKKNEALPDIPTEKLTLPIVVDAQAIVWLTVIGHIQLALRHPKNRGESAHYAKTFAAQVLFELERKGVLTREMRNRVFEDFPA
jgi:hypothetical protein